MKILKIEDCLPDYSEYDIHKCYCFSGTCYLHCTFFEEPKRIAVYCNGDGEVFTDDDKFTKKDIIAMMKEILKEYGI